MMCVFGRLMSQLADVNTQSTVGMCYYYNVVTQIVIKLVIFVHCGIKGVCVCVCVSTFDNNSVKS